MQTNQNNNNNGVSTSLLAVDEVLDSESEDNNIIDLTESGAYYDTLFSNLDDSPGFSNLWDVWNESGTGFSDISTDSWSYDSDGDAEIF